MNCSHVALSYVWGQGTKGLLTRSTLGKYTREGCLGEKDVPRTIRDAISLLKKIGGRYLWVDSLCIIQDDLSDKRQYLPMMGEIYNAAMVVVAAVVENAHSGLPGIGDYKRGQPRIVETIQGVSFTHGQPQLQDYLATTTWNTRGWTYQEAQLAKRVLIITEFQVYWSCGEASWCEDRFNEFPDPRMVSTAYNSLFTAGVPMYPVTGGKGFHIDFCDLGEYYQRVNGFTARCVSDQKDRLWAFFGILKSLLCKFPRGYIWGMPKAKLDSALLWKEDASRGPDSLDVPTGDGNWQEHTVSSWCWISKGDEVWHDRCYGSVESMVEWQEPILG